MNILVLNWRDPSHPLAGGAEIALFEHIKFWKKKEANIVWYASSSKGLKKEDVIDGIKILRKGSHYTVALHFLWDRLHGKFQETDVVIDCFHFIPYFSPLVCKNEKIIAFIHEVAGSVWFKNIFFPLNILGYILEPIVIRFYKNRQFITVSKSTELELRAVGISSRNIYIINNGIHVPKLINKCQKETTPTIIFVGRLSKDKGIEDAVTAVKMITERLGNISFWIVGKAENHEYEVKLKQMVSDLKLQNNCVFFGFVTEEKKFELMSRAWVLVHPSKKEGWGLNVIEANYVETPAVGYNVAGLKDSIVDNKTGLLTNSDPASLVGGIEKLLTDSNTRKAIGKNAAQWAKNFNWEDAGKQSWKLLGKIYEEK